MGFRIEQINNHELIEISNPMNGLVEPFNLLITASVGGAKCCYYKSLVTMADGTTKELYKVKEGEQIINYNIETGEAQINIVKDSINVGIKKGYKLTLIGGDSIICSEDHKFLKGQVKKPNHPSKTGTAYYIDEWNWTPLKQLKRMDLIATPQKYQRITYDIYDPKIYELIGYIIGNGGITNSCIISISHQMQIDRINSLLPESMHLTKKPSATWDYSISSKKRLIVARYRKNKPHMPICLNPIIEILKDLQLMGKKSKEKHIPPEILQASNSNLYRLLSGLLTTDGWIDAKGVGYGTSSDQLKDDFCTLLRNLGIDYYISRKNAKFQGKIFPAWTFGINKRENLQKIYDNCHLANKQEKLKKFIDNIKEKEKGQRGINKIYRTKDLKFQRIKKIEQLNETQMWDLEVESQTHNYIANNIIVHNTTCAEQVVNALYRNGYTVISLSDVKDGIEFGFSMFKPKAEYHLEKLNQFGCPLETIPTKIYHPFTFDLPKNDKLPDFNIYTLDIKTIGRIDLGFLAETNENKRSIQILLDTIQKLGKDEGIHHLIFKAEEQTENQANISKSGIKYRSDNADDFFTRSKIGTEKTSGEMSAYFKPFIQNYSITPHNCTYNLNIKEIMNDQKHYHIFTTKWIKDRRLKAFYIIHLLTQLIENEAHAKHPICIYLEEIRFLTPNSNDGFTSFLAEELKNTMTRMRNMGKGYAIVSTTQVFRDVHTSVVDSFNETIFGRIGIKETEFIGKALRLPTQDVNLIKSLEVGEFILKTKRYDEDEATLQKVKFYMPPHAHKEGRYSFFEFYEQQYPELMRTYNKEHTDITTIKQQVIDSVTLLKDKENQNKQATAKQEKEEKLEKEKLKLQIQNQKTNIKQTKDNNKLDKINNKIKELIYTKWKEDKTKSYRSIAKDFKILYPNGEPDHKSVQRAVEQMQRKYEPKTNIEDTETNNDDNEDTQDQYNETPEHEDP